MLSVLQSSSTTTNPSNSSDSILGDSIPNDGSRRMHGNGERVNGPSKRGSGRKGGQNGRNGGGRPQPGDGAFLIGGEASTGGRGDRGNGGVGVGRNQPRLGQPSLSNGGDQNGRQQPQSRQPQSTAHSQFNEPPNEQHEYHEYSNSQSQSQLGPAKPKRKRNRKPKAVVGGSGDGSENGDVVIVSQGLSRMSSHSDLGLGGGGGGMTSGRGSVPPSRTQSRNRQTPHQVDNRGGGGGLDPSAPAFAPTPASKQSNARTRLNPRATIPPPTSSRKAAFQGRLTSSYDTTDPEAEAMERAATGSGGKSHQHLKWEKGSRGRSAVVVEADDLASKLTRGLSGRPFLECPICFSPLLPSQAIWCCLPPSSSSSLTDSACCYTPFHLNCMRDWSSRSLAEAEIKRQDRIRDGAPRDGDDKITWRCPGCQKHREGRVEGYACFCGAVKNLKTQGGLGQSNGRNTDGGSSLATPHSCGQSCSRKRAYCSHPCPNSCHPGPCPPCQVPLVVPCPSHGSPLTVKCSAAKGNNLPSPVCDEVCDRVKACGNPEHRCTESCHEAPCEDCEVVETVICYCGEEEKVVPCGWGAENVVDCEKVVGDGEEEVQKAWTGRWACGRTCSRLYDCGIHSCPETCHPHPVEPLICPTSPAVITHCPCGACELDSLDATARTVCTDPIPTCGQRCPQPLSGCGHPCALDCHEGGCPPCQVEVIVPCRCGESKMTMTCYRRRLIENGAVDGAVLCDRVCQVMKNCGRHACSRRCCPLAYKAKVKGKRRDLGDTDEGDVTGLHACPLPCGKLLGCGIHTCTQLDHKGPCGRCLEASYEELVCHCGHTVLQPPIRCGTVLQCTYPCARSPPPCGHPKLASHTCHEREDCPPCPYLTEKACACGKNPAVKNVRCSQERVSCGAVCGKLLSCGGHRCLRSCHGDDCGPCDQICRKRKKLCQHPHDDDVCHAPSSCPEETACPTIITQSCPCGHLQQRASCGACTANPISKEKIPLKCVAECAQRQRNARLAEALGIPPSEKTVEYPVELKNFATLNHAFVTTVEKTFGDFFMSPKHAMVLPHTPVAKRQFVLGLAEIYRFGTELVDVDPHRSVQIRRRIDSRIPKPLLSTMTAAPAAAKRQLGSLGDMKKTTAGGGGPSFLATASTTTGGPIRPAPGAWASQPPTPRIADSNGLPGIASLSRRPSPLPSTRIGLESVRTVTQPNDDAARDWDASDIE